MESSPRLELNTSQQPVVKISYVGTQNNPHYHYRKNKEAFHCLTLLVEQFTSNFPLQSFSLAVNALHILSQSLLSYPLAYNLFNCVIHYFPIISRKGHILLIKHINLNLIYLMFSISQKKKKLLKSA